MSSSTSIKTLLRGDEMDDVIGEEPEVYKRTDGPLEPAL
jgi:hypothetical protein